MRSTEVSLKATKRFIALDITNSGWNAVSVPQAAKASTAIPKPSKIVEAKTVPTAKVKGSTVPTEEYEEIILNALNADGAIEDSWDLTTKLNLDHQVFIGVVKSLMTDFYVLEEPLSKTYWSLSAEGEGVAKNGSPEMRVLSAVPLEGGIALRELQSILGDVAKIGMGQCMKNKWVKKEGDLVIRLAPEGLVDETARILRLVLNGEATTIADENELKNLKKRKLVSQITRKSVRVTKGPEFREKRVRKVADLTKAMLGNKAEMAAGTHWSDVSFKSVNLKSMGAPATGGNFHPLLKVRAEFRRILMEMGFEEMPTSKWVESSFWNFDSLFQPQSHPARDMHDTFFMKSPAAANSVPSEYYERVKNTHEYGGGYGSIGYGCNFKREEAMKNLLRTHTTAISAQMLYRLGEQYTAAMAARPEGSTSECLPPKSIFLSIVCFEMKRWMPRIYVNFTKWKGWLLTETSHWDI